MLKLPYIQVRGHRAIDAKNPLYIYIYIYIQDRGHRAIDAKNSHIFELVDLELLMLKTTEI